jgi:hypothetical protein
MKSFGKPKPDTTPLPQSDVLSAIRDLTERFERLERAVRDIKQNVDLVPALVRKMYLADMKLEPPYDLQAERFSFSSQNDEDGLVLALIKRIGFTSRRFVELGCGMNGGNSGFLASELGWHGLMVDARDDAIRKIVIRFTGHDVTARQRHLTRENVNEFITECGFNGEIDVLSIDIDGMDYWIWQSLTACHPRLVVIEYNWQFGAERAVTIPYSAAFDVDHVGHRAYHGASLAALVDLGRSKGYRLVATERVNAFFLRHDVAPEIREIDARQGYRAPINFATARHVFADLDRAGLPLLPVGPESRD